MLTSLCGYAINTKASSYHNLAKFDDEMYRLWADTGMPRQFKGEEYFLLCGDLNLFGQECQRESFLAAINDVIYKIYVSHHPKTQQECKEYRDQAIDFLLSEMQAEPEIHNLSENHKIAIWDGKNGEGNVLLEADGWSTVICITSSSVRYAQKLSFFDKLFGRR